MKRLLYISVIILLFVSCKEEDTFTPLPPDIVVEGWIENDRYPVVILTKTFPVSTEFQDPNNLEGYLVRWAKVTISDGENSVVLTGRYDKTYFPPYVYTTSWLKGEVGKTYYLTVEYDHFHATAKTTIPAPPQIDRYKVEKLPDSDKFYQITACFSDNPNEKNYYQFFTKTGVESNQFIGSYMGSIDDRNIKEHVEFPVYRGHAYNEDDYYPNFSEGETVAVMFAQVDETSYRFWDAYTKSQVLNANMFLSTSTSLPSNISGGKGYWCGYGAVYDTFTIGE